MPKFSVFVLAWCLVTMTAAAPAAEYVVDGANAKADRQGTTRPAQPDLGAWQTPSRE